jgi:hypothetical protein
MTLGAGGRTQDTRLSMVTSIADCAICSRIPQKVAEDIRAGAPKIVPPEVDRLATVVELEDESTPAYCTSITRLLKCSVCGTLYYYNHYDDDGAHFMDPTCDEITVRRYDPLTAMGFLERITAGTENALPNTLGQLKQAFAEGTSAPTTHIAGAGLSDQVHAARQELDELRGRYDEIMHDLIEVIRHRSPDWQIKMYAVESLCHHFLSQGDWSSLSDLLLKHPDPVVRVSTARLVIGIATGDAPVTDLVHTARKLRMFLETEIATQARMDELVEVLLEVALVGSGMTFEYDHGYGSSRYSPSSTRSVALYGLVVAADHQAELAYAIPALVGMLSQDKQLNYQVCWVLRTAAKKIQCARAILGEIDKSNRSRKLELLRDAEVKRLVDECDTRSSSPRTDQPDAQNRP